MLQSAGDSARVLSGGATLIAMMNADLVQAQALISLAGIEELNEFRLREDGSVRIGAMRRHRQTAFESDLRAGQRVISSAAAQIANGPVRNMGTIGGSIAFADPAADYPPALVAANARFEIAGAQGRRELDAEDFFLGWYETALEAGEIVTAVIVPAAHPDSTGHYKKLCRVAGDFAIASVAICLTRRKETVETVRIAVGSCGPGPVRVAAADELLSGSDLNDSVIAEAAALIVAALDPVDDARASAAYRARVVPGLLRQALQEATVDG